MHHASGLFNPFLFSPSGVTVLQCEYDGDSAADIGPYNLPPTLDGAVVNTGSLQVNSAGNMRMWWQDINSNIFPPNVNSPYTLEFQTFIPSGQDGAGAFVVAWIRGGTNADTRIILHLNTNPAAGTPYRTIEVQGFGGLSIQMPVSEWYHTIMQVGYIEGQRYLQMRINGVLGLNIKPIVGLTLPNANDGLLQMGSSYQGTGIARVDDVRFSIGERYSIDLPPVAYPALGTLPPP